MCESVSECCDIFPGVPRASVTTFTRGGHGYADEEGLSSMASPHHAGYDEGAQLHHMDSAQQPDMSGAPGT